MKSRRPRFRLTCVRLLSTTVYVTALLGPSANGYVFDTTVPQAGGCPALDLWNISLAAPLNRRWSTSLPSSPSTIRTVAVAGSSAQLAEIEQVISDSFGAWFGLLELHSTLRHIPDSSHRLPVRATRMRVPTIAKATRTELIRFVSTNRAWGSRAACSRLRA
jgi:hypothetical protein